MSGRRKLAGILVLCLAVIAIAIFLPNHGPSPSMQRAILVAKDGAIDGGLGVSVAVDGGVVVVGAHRDLVNGRSCGAAYLFLRPSGGWSDKCTEVAKLVPSDGKAGDHFGVSVAVSGDVVFVGAYGSDASGPKSGVAYVFVKPPSGWSGVCTESAKLVPSDGAAGDSFGGRVSVDGNVVVVGAAQADDCGKDSGRAYIFLMPQTGWAGACMESATLHSSDGAANDAFGSRVSISGHTVVVGAPDKDQYRGAAYVFEKPSSGWRGTCTESARLRPAGLSGGVWFGFSVSVEGETVAVGAFHSDGLAGENSGSAYVFVKPSGGWSGSCAENAVLVPSDAEAGAGFGVSISVSGDKVVVGARWGGEGEGPGTTPAYVFSQPRGGWSGNCGEEAKIAPTLDLGEYGYGWAVAISGGTAALGARCRGSNRSGAAEVITVGER